MEGPHVHFQLKPTFELLSEDAYHVVQQKIVICLFPRDEINIPFEHQIETSLLGIIRDMKFGGRVGFDTYIKTDLTRAEVLKRYITLQHSSCSISQKESTR